MARILLVDDDHDTRITLPKAIEIMGHQPILAASGWEGLKEAGAQVYLQKPARLHILHASIERYTQTLPTLQKHEL